MNKPSLLFAGREERIIIKPRTLKMRKYEVEKYLQKAPTWSGSKYMLEIGGLKLFFKTKKEANEYYLQYLNY